MTVPSTSGVSYTKVDQSYFEKRGLRRYAGVWSLWALGVGAVISGHFSGWNLGLTNGWGSMLVATIIIAVMYLGLTFSLAEMSPALPHTGAAYSFARSAMGPWGGFLTGLAENVEYVLTPAVIVFFISTYMQGIFETPATMLPLWWVGFYLVFVWLNVIGVELSFKVTLVVTLLALACLVVFYIAALGQIDFQRWAMNVGPGDTELPDGNGPFLPNGWHGVLAGAAVRGVAVPRHRAAAAGGRGIGRSQARHAASGIILGMFTLMLSAFLILILNPAVVGVGAFKLGTSGEPLLDGFRALFGEGIAKILALVAVIGLIASFHTIIYRQGPADLFAVAAPAISRRACRSRTARARRRTWPWCSAA